MMFYSAREILLVQLLPIGAFCLADHVFVFEVTYYTTVGTKVFAMIKCATLVDVQIDEWVWVGRWGM
jgi:hypothetical protein